MRKKLALFPMTRDLCAVVRYAHLLGNYTLYASLVLPSWGLEGADSCKIDGGNPTGVTLVNYEERIIKECDVLFIDYNEYIPSLDVYRNAIDCATKEGKEVILSRTLSIKLELTPTVSIPLEKKIPEEIKECPVPVVSVLAQGDDTNQFMIELALRNHFVSKGYTVAQVGTHESGQFFGFAAQPDLLYENRNAEQMILLYNEYIGNMVAKEKADVLILGVPGAIMQFNDAKHKGFGVVPYIIANAVRADASVCSIYFNKNLNKYLHQIQNYCDYRLNCKPDCFHISNSLFELDMNEVKITRLPAHVVMESLIEEKDIKDQHIFHVMDDSSLFHTCDLIEKRLTGNISTIM